MDFVVPASLKFLQGYAFLAVPFYIIAGALMLETPMSSNLFQFLHSVLGRGRATFGSALVAFVAVFGAMSGSAAAAIAALGSMVIREGPRFGYERDHVAALLACSSLVAMLIPPSLTMIIFGVSGEVSIPLLFLATAVPGVLTALAFGLVNAVLVRRWKIAPPIEHAVADGTAQRRYAVRAIPTLVLPVIILGGIYGGIFTPTEAAAVAVAWVIIYQCVSTAVVSVKRGSFDELRKGGKNLVHGFLAAGRIIGAVGLVIFFMFALSRIMIRANVSQLIQDTLVGLISDKWTFLLVANFILFVLGMIMDDVSGCILAAIFLLPSAKAFHIDPLHFGAIVAINLGLGNLTPPVAPLLYFAAGIGEVKVKLYPMNKYTKTVAILLLFGQLPVLIITTYIPQVSLFLPHLWSK